MNEVHKKLIDQMSDEEKARMLAGKNFWNTAGCERLGIRPLTFSDGPHGLRRQKKKGDHLGLNKAEKAVCFLPACAAAGTFNPELMERMGAAIGREAASMGVDMILGPGLNLKRSPLGGRNFEYYSEDPLVSGKMAAALIRGIQSEGTGACCKHFLANNQETGRMSSSSDISERALHDLYLRGFEIAVKEGKPKGVMSAYNRVNDTFCSSSKYFLTDLLRDEWGFDGIVVSDWGAVDDRVLDLKAGLDVEMPFSGESGIRDLVERTETGEVSRNDLDLSCSRILSFSDWVDTNRTGNEPDYEADLDIAREAAEEAIILLKNGNQTLPLKEREKILFIGPFVKNPRMQGGGSSHINSWKTFNAWEDLKDRPGVSWVQGFGLEGEADPELEKEALEAAKQADTIVVFAGLPESAESEGYDRSSLDLPEGHNRLIEQLAESGKKVVVVLHNGGPVLMPWIDRVDAVLENYLGGDAVGKAVVSILYGGVNPSGKLAETFPLRVEDTPAYLTFGKKLDHIPYEEGVFAGYRWYDARKLPVLFPFGHGLSYTSFSYGPLSVERDGEEILCRLNVKNTGEKAGRETVQIYSGLPESRQIRPVRELKAFEKVSLQPGEEREVILRLNRSDLGIWSEKAGRSLVEEDGYRFEAGSSSRDLCSSADFWIEGDPVQKKYDLNTTLGELRENPAVMEIIGPAVMKAKAILDPHDNAMGKAVMDALPFRNLMVFGNSDLKDLRRMLETINKREL